MGNVASAYGQAFTFDLFDTTANGPFDQEDLILVGGGMTVVFDLTSNPGTGWTSYSVGLSEAGWRLDGLSGPAATQAAMLTVLGNLSSLYIRGEYQLGTDTRGLDNVILNGTTAVPEPGSLSLTILGLASPLGIAAFRRRRLAARLDV